MRDVSATHIDALKELRGLAPNIMALRSSSQFRSKPQKQLDCSSLSTMINIRKTSDTYHTTISPHHAGAWKTTDL